MGYSLIEAHEMATEKMSFKEISLGNYTKQDVIMMRDMLLWCVGHAETQKGLAESLSRDLDTINTISYRKG